MKIRTARDQDIPALYTTGVAARDADTAAYLTQLIDKRCTRPEWCFLASEDGRVAGSIVLWAAPGNDVPSAFVLLDTDWERTPEIAQALLDHATTAATELGAGAIEHVIDTPGQAPQHQAHPDLREKLLTDNAFALTRDGRRWEWNTGDPIPAPDTRLTWRSLPELGEAPFVELLAELLTDTRDSLLQASVKEHGPRGAAAGLLKDVLAMDHEDGWLELGIDPDGTPAAISLPARNPTSAVIGFVGVSPRHRGKGYATATVARGTQVLAQSGATTIRADCDTDNHAMVKGFERAGYRNFANRKEFQATL